MTMIREQFGSSLFAILIQKSCSCDCMAPKGGVRQRLRELREDMNEDERARDGGAEEVTEDKARTYSTGGRKRARTVGEFVSGLYLVGRLSAPELQEGAAAASSSSSSSAGPSSLTEELARAGADGRHRGNISRDVISTMSKRSKKPPVYSTKVLFWDEKKQEKFWEC